MFVVATVGGAAFATVRGLRAWRTLRRAQRTVGAGLLEVTRGIEGTEERIARAGDNAASLNRARVRLQDSLAVLSLLTAAAGDARAPLRALAFLRR